MARTQSEWTQLEVFARELGNMVREAFELEVERKEHGKTRARLADRAAERDAVIAERDSHAAKIQQLNNSLRTEMEASDELRKRRDDANAYHAELNDTIDTLRKQLAEKPSVIAAELAYELAQAKIKIAARDNEITQLTRRNAELFKENDAAYTQLRAVRDALD